MNINKMKSVIKERWKFYLIGYLIGYAIPLIMDGVPSWYCLFPVKLIAIACALTVGNAFYHGAKKMPVFLGLQKSIKYVAIVVLLFSITYLIKEFIMAAFGFDITPFIGIPKSAR